MQRPTRVHPRRVFLTLGFIRRIFLFAAVVSFATGMLPIIQLGQGYSGPSPAQSGAEGNPLNQIFFAVLYLAMVLIFLPELRTVFRVTLMDILVWSLIATCVLSVMWSLNAPLTMRRSVPLFGTALLAMILGTRLTSGQQLRLLAGALFTALISALGYILVFPKVGIDPQGAWQGYFPTKNELGRLASYLTIVTLYVPIRKSWSAIVKIGTPLLALFVIIMSSSATALVLWAAIVVSYLVFQARSQKQEIATFGLVVWTLLLAIAVSSVLLYFNFSAAMAMLGKDPTLTGRTYLWTSSIKAGLDRPILGYGYNGFWLGGAESPAHAIMEGARFPGATHAHNGYIDVFLDTGTLGLFLIVSMISATLVFGWRTWLRTGAIQDAWPIAFMVMIVVSNMVESIFLRHSAYAFLIFLTVAISTSRRYIDVIGPSRMLPGHRLRRAQVNRRSIGGRSARSDRPASSPIH